MCTTGSGRKYIGKLAQSDLIKNEITTTWKAVSHLHPETQTIFEIGGQDSKILTLKNGEISNFKLNSVCAAGTGSFIQQQANRLGISVEELSILALKSTQKAKFSGRCTVFVETEMINLQQNGYSLNAIAAGLIDAICENYLKDLTPAIEINDPILFCGGVSAIEAVSKSFETKLNKQIIVPKISKTAAAYGAALLAKDHYYKNKKDFSLKKLHLSDDSSFPHNPTNCTFSDCLNCGKCFEFNKNNNS
jgi:predicted CoA-substrate-specific enzyme activase